MVATSYDDYPSIYLGTLEYIAKLHDENDKYNSDLFWGVRHLLNALLDNLSAITKPYALNWPQIGGQYSRGSTNCWDRTELCVGVISEYRCMNTKDLLSKWQFELVCTCILDKGRQTTHSGVSTLTRKGERMYSRRHPW